MSDEIWSAVRQELARMSALLETPRDTKRLYSFADAYQRLAKAYHVALQAEGKSSVRMQAVEKALDLTTGKTALQRFVAADSGPREN